MWSSVLKEIMSFLSALGLMTRIPITLIARLLSAAGILPKHYLLNGYINFQPEHYNRSQIWYPWVGLFLGLLLGLVFILLPENWSALLSASVLLCIWVGLTGALHLDGLADSVDAWVGGMASNATDRVSKTLAIMKDPTSGPMAVTVLVLVLLLKVALIAQLVSTSLSLLAILTMAPLCARAWLLPLLYSTPYARKSTSQVHGVQTLESLNSQGGMATDIASDFPLRAAIISFVTSQVLILTTSCVFALSITSGFFLWLVINLFAALAYFIIRRATLNRIGGYTGDVLGAYIELQELGFLFVIALFFA